jgi:hypothetical protein
MNGRTLDKLEKEIRVWIDPSTVRFNAQFSEAQRVWVLKL